jgi:hypothetical protein
MDSEVLVLQNNVFLWGKFNRQFDFATRLKETKYHKAYLICEPLWLGAFVVNFSIIK